jgi:hypothetical protein
MRPRDDDGARRGGDDVTAAGPVSVVVTSYRAPALLRRCLTALVDHPSAGETIVVEGSADDPAAWVAVEFPGVKVLHLRDRSVPELRWAGARAASGSIVAATESWMRPASDWCAVLAGAHARWPEAPVIGGDVALEPNSPALGAGFYLCEYAAFAAPVVAGEAMALSSANLSYKRDALLAERDVLDAGQWELVLHERWRGQGRPLRILPATVTFRNGLTGAAALSMRFRYGRAYAADRFSPAARSRRAVYAAGSVLLPIVLTWRVIRHAAASGHVADLCRSFGWILLLNASWALGEGAGYLRGAGRSTIRRPPASPAGR